LFRMQQGFAFPAIASSLCSGFFHMRQHVFAFPDIASSRKCRVTVFLGHFWNRAF
jgi:hypothetical protein